MLESAKQISIDISEYSGLFDIIITKDNYFRKINEMIDFNFIYEEIKNNYSTTMGRPAEDPERMFKYMLLKSVYKLSDRDLIKRTLTDMEFKYFLGYAPDETVFINHSSLSKFRHLRLKDLNLIDIMINKTVEIAIEKGLIDKNNSIILDSTHTNSMFSHISPREDLIKRAKELRKIAYKFDENIKTEMPKKRETSGLLDDVIEYSKELIELIESKDMVASSSVSEKVNYLKEGLEDINSAKEYSKEIEASVGHKSADTSFFGFKSHIAMSPERIISACTITSGEKHDGKQLQELVEKSQKAGIEVKAVIGDGAYSESENIEYCKAKAIRLASKLSKSVTHGNRSKSKEFEYNKDAQMYVCPVGHMSTRKVRSGNAKEKVESYYFDIEKCQHCPKQEGCYKTGSKSKTYNVKIKEDIHLEHMEYIASEEFHELYGERYKIEAKNGELKNNYGYGSAQSCGLLGMSIQAATTIFMSNIKRIMKLEENNKY